MFLSGVKLSPEYIEFARFAGGGFGGGSFSVETLYTANAAKGVL